MFKLFIVYLGISFLPALVLLGNPNPVVRYVSLGILFILMILYIISSSPRTGHVLDNALSFVIASVLLVVVAVVCAKVQSRLKANKEKESNHTVDPSAMTLRVTSVMPPAGRFATGQEPHQTQVALGHG